MKTELGVDTIHASHDAATAAVGESIDDFYNTRRRHSHHGYVSPFEFGLKSQVAAIAA